MIRKIGIFQSMMLFLFLSSCSYFSEVNPADKIILITLDTTRANHLGCYGYENIETPNLDLLAAEGILFTNAICQVPITLPSHVSIFTGKYPPEHGVRLNTGYILKENIETLAEILLADGYKTGAVVSSYAVSKQWGIAQGFEDYDDVFSEEEDFRFSPKAERRADASIASALDWLDNHKDEKFFIWIHLYDPHADYEPPPPFSEIYKDNLYDGEIAFMDHEIGKIWAFLKEKNLWNDTLIIVLGDHGEGLGDHNELTHATLIYESTIQIPLIIKAKNLPEGIRVKEISSTIDIMPTILDYLKFQIPSELKGKTLLDFTNRKKQLNVERDLYIETLSPRIMFGWSELKGLRREHWKYIRAPEPELFNLEKDPHERMNLYEKELEIAKRMQEGLNKIEREMENKDQSYSEKIAMDDESRDILLSLGYISASDSQSSGETSKNPKDYVFLEFYFENCIKAFEEKDFLEAINICNTILGKDPENKAAGLLSAQALIRLGHADKAAAQLSKLLDIYEGDSYSFVMLSDLYLSQQKYQEAEKLLTEALKYHPNSYEFHYALGASYYGLKRIDEAMKILEKAISINSWDFKSHVLLSRCYHANDMSVKAREHMETAYALGFKEKE